MNKTDFLRHHAPFHHLSEGELEELCAASEAKSYPAQQFLFHQDEKPHPFIYLVLSGMVEIMVKMETGRSLVVGTRTQGDFFGETGVLAEKPYAASVKTATETTLLLIPKEQLFHLMAQNAPFAASFSHIIMEHLRQLFAAYSHEPVSFKHLEEVGEKRASEMMTSPVITCGEEDSIQEILRKLAELKISALVVTDSSGELKGLITEKDLLRKGFLGGEQEGLTAASILDQDPVTVRPASYYYQILLEMIKKQAKHAIVMAEKKPIGMITYRDLLKMKNLDYLQITERIGEAKGIDDLIPLPALVDRQLAAWEKEKAPIPQILDLVTEFYDQMTVKLIDICLKEMEPTHGTPPLPFCWLTMGSGGRREQFMRTDQDNALLYAKTDDPELQQRAENFFTHLSARIVEGLVRLGFSRCPGNVMATNPIWRGDWEDFFGRVAKWILLPAGENLRNLTIFLDFRPLYGDFSLAENLRHAILQMLADTPISFRFLGEDAVKGNLPLGIFGRPLGEKSGPHRDELDLKGSVTVYLTDTVRLLSLEAMIETTNTLERIEALTEKGILPRDFSDQLKEAFETFLHARIALALREMEKGRQPTSYLPLKGLSRNEQTRLKHALHTLERLIEIVTFKYHLN